MELFYRPNEDDDWGQIRDDTGRLFAVVSFPMSIDQLNEHRRNKTDPYKDLADRLIWTYADPASQFVLNASLIEERDRLRAALEQARDALNGEPEYHRHGMGCGLEDRNITDRYDAMEHGWEKAIERVYGENIAWAVEIIDAALSHGDKT